MRLQTRTKDTIRCTLIGHPFGIYGIERSNHELKGMSMAIVYRYQC
jgi:hypothetical protein